jgi:predicted DNA binding CopG/RHH family protein
MVKRETYENMRKEYEKKLEQNEEKESKLRQQL